MNQKKYLIYEWTNTDDPQPLMYEVTLDRLLEMMNDLRFQKEVKFAAYEIGECVVDWS